MGPTENTKTDTYLDTFWYVKLDNGAFDVPIHEAYFLLNSSNELGKSR